MGAAGFNSVETRATSERFADVEASEQDQNEWEYEYNEDETEDYYFTLDLTTHQTGRAQNRGPTAKRRRLSGPNNGTSSNSPVTKSATDTFSNTATARSDPSDELQVLDLHSEKPLVLLNGQLYSCRWSTDLGTQFYVARPGTVEKPLRAGRVVDIAGLSRARLVGSPVIARPRRKDPNAARAGATATNAISIDEDDGDVENEEEASVVPTTRIDESASMQGEPTTAERFARARREAQTPQAKAKVSFLERLSAIKQKKGETDEVPVSGVKEYELPSNQDEIRKASIAADAENENAKNSLTAKNRKRGSYKRKESPAVDAATPTPEQRRGKSGPKTGSAIKSSLGLSGGNG